MKIDDVQAQSDAIVEAIKPLLAGQHPGVQGIVLADLTAIWLAGHAPETFEALLATHMKGIRDLVPLYRERFGT